jgi:outer membrane immunogenic protein
MRLKLAGFVVAAASLLAAQSAFAADMPTKMPVKAAPMAAATPWTGFYVNGGIGYGMWAADTGTYNPVTGACAACSNQVQGGKGWLGVVGGGFDYQFTSRIVAGVFGDFNISSLKGTIQDEGPFFAGDIKQTSSWAAGARAGWLVTPMVMSYVNGGFTSARFSSASMVRTQLGAPTAASTPAFTANGWFMGGGLEAAIAPGWFWRNEYRYAYYGTKLLPDTDLTGTARNNISFKPTVQTVTTQLVYKFDPGHMAPAYTAPPMIAANWTGFYLNAGAGYGMWAADTTTLNPATGLCDLCSPQRQGGKGYLGTVGAGYDWQFAPAWVAGVFGDFDVSSIKGSIQDQGPVTVGDIKQTSAWAAGARAGWLVTPAMLTYVNGGYSSARFSGVQMAFEYSPFALQGTSQGFTTSGWFIGGGAETTFDMLGMLGKGWFWRNEYRYASYNTQTIAITGSDSITFKPVVQTVTSLVVFKFN